MTQIARREFLKHGSVAAALAASGFPSVSLAPGAAASAASRAESASDARALDSLEFSRSMYAHTTPTMTFAATDSRSASRWQLRVRRKLVELLGGFPASAAVLNPAVVERKDLGAYTREKIVFQTRENLSAVGYLLLAANRPSRGPALVCLPGHGRGAAELVGMAEDGTERVFTAGERKPMAIRAVEEGYAAFALEQLGFGDRRDEAARTKGPQAYSCQPAAGAALLLGQTMVGWRVWDVMRTIDYLATRPEIDASRIGTIGVSGGGTTSFFSAALDDRIKAAVVSAYLNTFRDSILSISHCMCNYVPRILEYIEMSDLAGLVAPRFLYAESGERDRIFPIAGSRAAADKARRIYAAFGVADRFGYDAWDGEHGFNGSGAFAFLKTRL